MIREQFASELLAAGSSIKEVVAATNLGSPEAAEQCIRRHPTSWQVLASITAWYQTEQGLEYWFGVYKQLLPLGEVSNAE